MYLASEQLTLADLFLAPILFWLKKTSEGQAAA
jgi:glutathione S-transferase